MVAALGSGACGEADGADTVMESAPYTDGRRAELEAGEGQLLVAAPPFQVAPGVEIQNCFTLPPTEADLHVTRYVTRQGAGGHHLVFYESLAERTEGVWEDCTAPESHAALLPVLAALNAPANGDAHAEFPEGMALLIPAGTRLVAQAHYINVTDAPITTGDAALLDLFDTSDGAEPVDLHTAPIATIDYAIPPGESLTKSFECEVPSALELVLLVPHMHEFGTRFTLQMGAADAMRDVIDVQNWEPDMRDRPPLTDFTGDAPSGVLASGDHIRVSCSWTNTTDQTLRFPQEMCAGFGYFLSHDPGVESFSCVN